MKTDRPKSRRRWLARAAWSMAAVLVVCALGFTVFRLAVAGKVDAELDRIRQAGHPATPAELEAAYALPPGQPNPADTYAPALAALDRFDQNAHPQIPVFGQPDFPWTAEQEKALLSGEAEQEQSALPEGPAEPTGAGRYGDYFGNDEPKGLSTDWRERVEALLAEYEKALQLIRQGAAMGPARFAVDLTDGLDADLTHLGKLRTAAQMLTLAAGLHYRDGGTSEALDEVQTILGLSEAIAPEPTLISMLVSVSLRSQATELVREMLIAGQLSSADLERVIAMLEPEVPRAAVERALAGERAIGNGVFLDDRENFGAMATVGLLDLDHLAYLDYMERTIAAAIPIDSRTLHLPDLDAPPYALVTAIMAPAVDSALQTVRRQRVTQRMTRAAAAVQLYHRRHGRVPAAPADVVGQTIDRWPIDLFAGAPLAFAADDTGGVRIWSTGPDGQDDGGAIFDAEDPWRSKPGFDLVFTLPRR